MGTVGPAPHLLAWRRRRRPSLGTAAPAGAPLPSSPRESVSDLSRFRDLSIIAHIDHGKSHPGRPHARDLTGAVDPRDMRAQYLDSMDIERERGITIKLQNVRLD